MNSEYVAVKAQDLKTLAGFIANLWARLEIEGKANSIEDSWNDFVQPLLDIANGGNNEHAKYILAKDVDIEIFKENLKDIYDYDISNLTDKQITDLYNNLQERLASSDEYSSIYNEALQDAINDFEKQFVSIESKIQQADVVKAQQGINQYEKNAADIERDM